MIVKTGEKGNGDLPLQKSFIQLDQANVILSSIKKAEDGSNCWVMQLYESSGNPSSAQLTFPLIPGKIFLSNFLEEDLQLISHEKNLIGLDFKKYEIKTIKVYW